jgi:hypothetical protein
VFDKGVAMASALQNHPVRRGFTKVELLIVIAIVAALIGLMVSAVLFFKEDPRTTSDKEGRYVPGFCLKELAWAMFKYDEKHGRLPPAAVYGKDGAPLLSWRVILLPYLEQEDLFRQFKLDEPWDGPHNIQLLPRIPYSYAPLEGHPPLEPYTTLFQVFVGKGTAFEGREGWRLNEDFPRRSYTILIAEAGKSVPWTKPEDISYNESQPLPKLGGFFEGYSHVVMVDGMSVRVPQNISQARFRAAIMRNNDGPWLWDD